MYLPSFRHCPKSRKLKSLDPGLSAGATKPLTLATKNQPEPDSSIVHIIRFLASCRHQTRPERHPVFIAANLPLNNYLRKNKDSNQIIVEVIIRKAKERATNRVAHNTNLHHCR